DHLITFPSQNRRPFPELLRYVVRQKDFRHPKPPGGRSTGHRTCHPLRLALERKGEYHSRATWFLVFPVDGPSVNLDDGLRNQQADPQPSGSVMILDRYAKQPIAKLSRDTFAIVRNKNLGLRLPKATAQGDHLLGLTFRCVDGILDQDIQNPVQPLNIRSYLHGVRELALDPDLRQ